MLWVNAVKAFVNTKVQTTVTVTSNSINTAMVIHVQGTGDYLLPEAYTIKYNNVDIYPKTREINNTVYHVIPAKDKSFVLKVLDHSDVPEPFPKNIAQTDKSTFLASANAQLKSPYQSLVQETVIKVAGTIKRSNSPHLAKTTQNSLSFSFDQVPPNSEFLSVIHYEATSPCLIFNSYEKSVEISHWFSKLLFVEHFDIQNCGPKVENFNRILYMANPGKGSVVNELVARLPPAASDIYYKDTIGNVSTSRVFVDSKSTRLALRPRYPLFGGMRYSWFHGYSALFDQFLKTLDSGRFQLFVPVAPSVASIPARQYKLKIMLPEQAFDIEINNSVDMNTQESTSYSYFDTTGKPTITFSSDAFYPDNVGVVAVTYSLPPFWKFRKPAVIASAVLCAMAALWLLTNLQFSLSVGAKRLVPASVGYALAHPETKEFAKFKTFQKASLENLEVVSESLKKVAGQDKIEQGFASDTLLLVDSLQKRVKMTKEMQDAYMEFVEKDSKDASRKIAFTKQMGEYEARIQQVEVKLNEQVSKMNF